MHRLARRRITWIGGWFGVALFAMGSACTFGGDLALDSDQKIVAALRTRVTATWQAVHLEKILAELHRDTGVRFEIDRNSFQQKHQDSNPELTCQLGRVTALQSLRHLGLPWHVVHGAVVVCAADTDMPLIVRSYDISKLKGWLRQSGIDRLSPSENPHLQIAILPSPKTVAVATAPSPEQIVSDFLQWGSGYRWMVRDAAGGSIQHDSDRMIVTQTFPGQMEVAATLDTLSNLIEGSTVRRFRNWDAALVEEADLQAALNREITIQLADVQLHEALAQIAEVAGVPLAFDPDELSPDVLLRRVSVQARDETLRLVLRRLLHPIELATISEAGRIYIVSAIRCEPPHSLIGYRVDGIAAAADRKAFASLVGSKTSSRWLDLDQEGATLTWFGPKLMLIGAPPRCHAEIMEVLSRMGHGPVAGLGLPMNPNVTAIANHAIAAIGWILFAIWAIAAGLPSLWFIGRDLRRRSDLVPDPAEWPLVTVVVPARDEGHKIEAGLQSLIASDYPNLEIIAIDDRSRDDTGAIMDQLAESAAGQASTAANSNSIGGCPRLRVVHVTTLPEGWLGKNHALQVGSEQARGEWILFTDGDVIHRADTLRRTIKYALARNLDHLPLFPNIEAHSVFEAAFVACFALVFTAGTQPGLVPSRFPWFYVGVGAYNLVRRSALQRAGSFEPIRLDILDDVKLGKLMKRTGSRSEVLRAGDGLNIRWQQSAWLCVTGLEKNAFASANYSVPQLLGTTAMAGVVFVGPLLGTLFAGDARTGYVAALVLSHLIYGFSSGLFGHAYWLFPFLIPSGLAFLYAFLRSTWITLRQGGVRWRDTFYPLKILRQNVYH